MLVSRVPEGGLIIQLHDEWIGTGVRDGRWRGKAGLVGSDSRGRGGGGGVGSNANAGWGGWLGGVRETGNLAIGPKRKR